ncbi:MAG: hypothetical protein AAFW65_02830 [Pseudomonadota bacterium]
MRKLILLIAIACVLAVLGVREVMGGVTGQPAGNINFSKATNAERAVWMQKVAQAEARHLIAAAKAGVRDDNVDYIGERVEAAASKITMVLRYEEAVTLEPPLARYQRQFLDEYCRRFLRTPSSKHNLTYIVSHQYPDGDRLIDVEVNNRTCRGRGG